MLGMQVDEIQMLGDPLRGSLEPSASNDSKKLVATPTCKDLNIVHAGHAGGCNPDVGKPEPMRSL